MGNKIERRKFLKIAGTAGAFALNSGFSEAAPAFPARNDDSPIAIGPLLRDVLPLIDKGRKANITPLIRREIEDNPRAVFLIETGVKGEKDERGCFDSAGEQIRDAGHDAANMLFEKGTKTGGVTAIHPNFATISAAQPFTTIGITTCPHFIAGFGTALKSIGNSNILVAARGNGGFNSLQRAGHIQIIQDAGFHTSDLNYRSFFDYIPSEIRWNKLRKGVVVKNLPNFRPLYEKDTLTINMAKMKAHNLGMTTLTIKNRQGCVPKGYGHFCDRWHQLWTTRPEMHKNLHKDFWQRVEKEFLRHRSEGWKYWDSDGAYDMYQQKGGWGKFSSIKEDRKQADEFFAAFPYIMIDEVWCQRTADALEVMHADLNIVEGVIGRDGDGFARGTDHLANWVVAGKSMVETDTVASWLMGHDPRELYYLRIANERGYGEIDPARIDIYILSGNEFVKVRDYRTLRRVPLGIYMHRNTSEGLRFF